MDRQGRILLPAYLRESVGLGGDAVVVGSRDHAEIWAPSGGTTTAGRSMTRRSWPAPSRGSGSSSHHMRFQDPLGIRFVRDGGEMHEGHLPVLVDEVISMLAPAPGSLQIDATLGGGGHTERILEATDPMAASSVSMPMGRPSPGSSAWPLRRPARPPPGQLPRARDRRAGGRFGAVDGCLFDLGLSSFQLADRGARLRLPRRRPARHALRSRSRRPGGGAAGHPRCGRADRPLPALRRGAEGGPDRPGHRRGPAGRADRHRRGAGRARRAGPAAEPSPAAPNPPRDPRLPGPADRGQRGARRARGRPRCRARPAPPGRPPGRPELPLARGPDRQAVHPGGAARLRLSARGAGLRLRPEPAPAPGHPPVADTGDAEITANPRARSARLRAAERLAA